MLEELGQAPSLPQWIICSPSYTLDDLQRSNALGKDSIRYK